MRENCGASGVVVDTQLFLRAETIVDEALGRVETGLAQEGFDRFVEPLGLVEHDEMFAASTGTSFACGNAL